MNQSLRDAVLQVAGKTKWATIDQIREAVSALPEFNWEDYLGTVEDVYKTQANVRLRTVVEKIVDETGFPVFASIKRTNSETGEEERIYKQEAMFDIDDYKVIVDYHASRANHHAGRAKAYAERGNGRYQAHIQPRFDF